ncbi:hypothetical protein Nepgr_011211 [Nepenthes gracilis]|uniref:Uncharacterized protein n=1 Tax=Nepenthes gracilis TaxID=150966 RepID=A0AAD3SET7_NEPGR|nr:hypothetical protein Nepgr_011211 [Nepenthes gracilis]
MGWEEDEELGQDKQGIRRYLIKTTTIKWAQGLVGEKDNQNQLLRLLVDGMRQEKRGSSLTPILAWILKEFSGAVIMVSCVPIMNIILHKYSVELLPEATIGGVPRI